MDVDELADDLVSEVMEAQEVRYYNDQQIDEPSERGDEVKWVNGETILLKIMADVR